MLKICTNLVYLKNVFGSDVKPAPYITLALWLALRFLALCEREATTLSRNFEPGAHIDNEIYWFYGLAYRAARLLSTFPSDRRERSEGTTKPGVPRQGLANLTRTCAHFNVPISCARASDVRPAPVPCYVMVPFSCARHRLL